MFRKKKDKKKLEHDYLLEDEIIVSSSDIAKALSKDDKQEKQIEEPLEEIVVEENVEPVIEERIEEEKETEKLTPEVDPKEVNEILAKSIILDGIPEDDDVEEEREDATIEEELPQASIPVASLEPSEKNPITFTWYDYDEYKPTKKDKQLKAKLEKQKAIQEKKNNKLRKKGEVVEEQQTEEFNEEFVSKRSLESFFTTEHKDIKKRKLTRKEKKALKKKEKRQKRKSRRKQVDEAIKDQKIFKFKKKKYAKVEDFITYLNDHYLDIDQIAVEVLKDENFFGWISKKSGVFDSSLREFKAIKSKIENEE